MYFFHFKIFIDLDKPLKQNFSHINGIKLVSESESDSQSADGDDKVVISIFEQFLNRNRRYPKTRKNSSNLLRNIVPFWIKFCANQMSHSVMAHLPFWPIIFEFWILMSNVVSSVKNWTKLRRRIVVVIWQLMSREIKFLTIHSASWIEKQPKSGNHDSILYLTMRRVKTPVVFFVNGKFSKSWIREIVTVFGELEIFEESTLFENLRFPE